jgi:hypothetical protein
LLKLAKAIRFIARIRAPIFSLFLG